MKIKNYSESKTNNNHEQDEHTIIVLDTQDVPNNQAEENVNNSVRYSFFKWSGYNKSQPKEGLIIHSKVLN